jgi:hypothetical protein
VGAGSGAFSGGGTGVGAGSGVFMGGGAAGEGSIGCDTAGSIIGFSSGGETQDKARIIINIDKAAICFILLIYTIA